MKSFGRKFVTGLVGVGLGMAAMGTAHAWWGGGPWGGYGPYGGGPYGGGPYGSSAMTQDRQVVMRDHGRAMRDLDSMFDGRRTFDRVEATKLAREMESATGENLWRLYAPGSISSGSRSMPWIWNNFDAFKGYAEGAKAAAGKLAEALEKRPTGRDLATGHAYLPRGGYGPGYGGFGPGYGRGYGNRWGQRGGAIDKEALEAFNALTATCHSCHANFRGGRW